MSVMSRKPTRRLASRTLRKAFRAFVVPTVAEKFQVISMRAYRELKAMTFIEHRDRYQQGEGDWKY